VQDTQRHSLTLLLLALTAHAVHTAMHTYRTIRATQERDAILANADDMAARERVRQANAALTAALEFSREM
jgi:hypothetical protein